MVRKDGLGHRNNRYRSNTVYQKLVVTIQVSHLQLRQFGVLEISWQSIISQLPITISLHCLALASNARVFQHVLTQTKVVKQAVKVGQRVDHTTSSQGKQNAGMQMQQKMLKIQLKGQKVHS
jgi:hypothetical protein